MEGREKHYHKIKSEENLAGNTKMIADLRIPERKTHVTIL
jgi:hypothetical protein